jgi:DNA segregation ATPase FtsK/SpoIIIE-like protein
MQLGTSSRNFGTFRVPRRRIRMRSIRTGILAVAVAAVAMLPLDARAQIEPVNQDTFFTFSQPVELPGATLPAGTYLFQLVDSKSNRHIVRVLSEDRQQVHATVIAIPSYSIERPADEPQVRFVEGPETGPQAVKMWFYPGRTVGHEFIYPRQQATRLAERTGDSVLTTRTDDERVADTVAEQDITRIDRDGRDAAAEVSGQRLPETSRAQAGRTADRTADNDQARRTADRTEPAPAPDPAEPRAGAAVRTEQERQTQAEARVQPQQQPQQQPRAQAGDRRVDTPEDRAARRELPRTAGMLPLLAIIGVGSLIGSRWLRRSRRSQF